MKNIVEAGYDAIAERYLEWSLESDWPGRRSYMTHLVDAVPAGADVLELGCGAGIPATRALVDAGLRVTAVDISERQLELARRNVPEARLIKADMTELDLPESSFDAVCAFYSLTHVPRGRHEELLRRIAVWLRRQGIFVASFGGTDNLSEVDEDWFGAPMLFSHFDAATTVVLVENAGFQILRRELIPQVEHGVEGESLWLVARSI
jgi:ubiquinone/menaquinone biosynthesis C-methylase UbiE